MARFQLALNVADLDAAVDFSAKLFGVEPAKRKPGYANVTIVDPPLELVLMEGGGEPGSIDHLGVEVASTDEVEAATARFAGLGLATDVEEHTTCCSAVLDKVWVTGPDVERFEVSTVLADTATFDGVNEESSGSCCTLAAEAVTLLERTVERVEPCC